MEQLLAELRRSFDMVIIDTPPLLPVTDAAVAARLADGAVVIVRYGKTTRSQLATALRSLNAVDARLLGTVLTMTPAKGAEAYSAYGYYEKDPKKSKKKQKTYNGSTESAEAGFDIVSEEDPEATAVPAEESSKSAAASQRLGLRQPSN